MNEGVQILLERMKTHPEEFVADMNQGSSKWGRALHNLQEHLLKEDRQALDAAWKQTVSEEMQRRFTQAVLQELVDPTVEKEQWGDSALDAQVYLQQAQATQAHIQLHQKQLAMQAQAAQQATNSYANLGGAGQGLLGTLFGNSK